MSEEVITPYDHKRRQSDEIAVLTEEYLARGGVIEVVQGYRCKTDVFNAIKEYARRAGKATAKIQQERKRGRELLKEKNSLLIGLRFGEKI